MKDFLFVYSDVIEVVMLLLFLLMLFNIFSIKSKGLAVSLLGVFGIIFCISLVFLSEGYYSIIAMTLRLLLLGIEFLIPGFGIVGVCGIVCLIFSVRLLNLDMEYLNVASVSMILFVISAVIYFLRFGIEELAGKLPSKNLDEEYKSVDDSPLKEGMEGVSLTPLRPEGYVSIEGEKYYVTLESGYLEKDREVVVDRTVGPKAYVREKNGI